MKKLLVITFAITSLLRPGLVLCMEPTGDVRLELPEAFCCESESATSGVEVCEQPTGDCDGCVDVALSTHSLMHKRTSEVPTLSALHAVLPSSSSLYSSVVTLTASTTATPARVARLSTVIRC